MKRIRAVLPLVCCLVAAVPDRAGAQTAENVLVVVNSLSAPSQQIGVHYMKARDIPAAQIVRVEVPEGDIIPRALYQERIERPITDWLARNSAHDRILYVVLTKGIPLRIDGTRGRAGTGASVDSELTLLYRRMTGVAVAPQGPIANPYFRGPDAAGPAATFTHRDHDIFLVTRLDGFTTEDVIALIDRGVAPSRDGVIVLDQKADLSKDPGDGWLRASADLLRSKGFGDRTVLETTTRAFTGPQPVLGYYSWGSNDPAVRNRNPGLTFSPGAIAGMFLSSDARTFREPPAKWTAGDWTRQTSQFAGSPQSLTGDLIRAGVTGAAGYVDEPFADGAVRPDVLFPAYIDGFNLAESFYLATPYLSWQSVVVGDPLCAPFARSRAHTDDLRGSLDPTTELPAFFSARRLAAVAKEGLQDVTVQEYLRGESRIAHGDRAGAQKVLEAATAREPRFSDAQMLLASIYETSSEHDRAIERYRIILTNRPNDALALNNLAYGLAVHQQKPDEALPLARKAYSQLQVVESADTLGWVLHLTGDNTAAALIYRDIVRTVTKDAETLLHAAIVFAAAGHPDDAAQVLTRATALNPALETRPEVKELRARLARK
jgi:uncharacterized protein (TIGR03790 family)